MKLSYLGHMAISRIDFWSFIIELVTRNPAMGIPALEDGLFANLLLFDYLYYIFVFGLSASNHLFIFDLSEPAHMFSNAFLPPGETNSEHPRWSILNGFQTVYVSTTCMRISKAWTHTRWICLANKHRIRPQDRRHRHGTDLSTVFDMRICIRCS